MTGSNEDLALPAHLNCHFGERGLRTRILKSVRPHPQARKLTIARIGEGRAGQDPARGGPRAWVTHWPPRAARPGPGPPSRAGTWHRRRPGAACAPADSENRLAGSRRRPPRAGDTHARAGPCWTPLFPLGSPRSPEARACTPLSARGFPAAGSSHKPGQAPLRLPAYWFAERQRPPKTSSDWFTGRAWLSLGRRAAAGGAGIPEGAWFVNQPGQPRGKF